MFNGKTHYKWPFSIAMLNYQRVIEEIQLGQKKAEADGSLEHKESHPNDEERIFPKDLELLSR